MTWNLTLIMQPPTCPKVYFAFNAPPRPPIRNIVTIMVTLTYTGYEKTFKGPPNDYCAFCLVT